MPWRHFWKNAPPPGPDAKGSGLPQQTGHLALGGEATRFRFAKELFASGFHYEPAVCERDDRQFTDAAPVLS